MDGFYLVQEGGGRASGKDGTVQIPGVYPVPYRRQLGGDPPEHQEGK